MTIGTVIEPINQQITCLKRSWALSLGKCQCLDGFGQCEESVRKNFVLICRVGLQKTSVAKNAKDPPQGRVLRVA